MKFLKNLVFISTLLSNYTYGTACTTCNIQSTAIHVNVHMEAKKDYTLFNIEWKFSQKFLVALMKHDKNKNGILDKDELKEIQNDLEISWQKHEFYTFVKLIKKNDKLKENKGDSLTLLGTKLEIKENSLIYRTQLKSDMVIKKDHYIYLRHFDRKMHYSFKLSNVTVSKYSGEIHIKKKKYIAYIEFFKN